MRVIAGLGNPGSQYEGTRHNAGFLVVDELARKHRASFRSVKDLEICEVTLGGKSVYLAKPMTFMNRSGEPLREFCGPKGIGIEDILVVHDELDLPQFTLRIKVGGGEGGHNGLRSISSCFGTKEYARLRFGIDKPTDPRFEITAWVLGRFDKGESAALETSLVRAGEGVEMILSDGIKKAQNLVNSFD